MDFMDPIALSITLAGNFSNQALLLQLISDNANQQYVFALALTHEPDFVKYVAENHPDLVAEAVNEHHLYGSSRLGVKTHKRVLLQKEFSIRGFEEDGTYIVDQVMDSFAYESSSSYFCRVLGQKQYEMSNHLGNVLATVLDRRTGVFDEGADTLLYYVADVVNATLYYPFGSSMVSSSNTEFYYSFGYSGVEKVNEVAGVGNHLDYGARGRDPRLVGGWWSPDPLAAKYPGLSPYHYTGNNPILFVDYDGRDFGVKINHETKTIVVVANVYTTNKTAYDQAVKSSGVWNTKSATVDGYAVTFQVKVMEASKSPMSREDIIKGNPSLVNKRGKVNEGKLATIQNKILDNAAWSSASSDDIGNVYAGNKGYNSKNVSGESYVGGVTANGKHISMNTHDESGDMGAFKDLVTHEFGHLMGLDDAGGTYHSTDGIMKYKGTSLNPISDNDVKDILKFAKDALGGKTKETDAKVKLIEQTGKSDGTNPIGVKNE